MPMSVEEVDQHQGLEAAGQTVLATLRPQMVSGFLPVHVGDAPGPAKAAPTRKLRLVLLHSHVGPVA